MKEKMVDLVNRRRRLLERLIEPARAAANQMKDARMVEGAAPLAAVLFELEVLDAELLAFVSSNHKEIGEMLLGMMTRPPGGGR